MRWQFQKAWPQIVDVARDVTSLTLGAVLIIHEAYEPHPDPAVLLVIAGLIVPSGHKYIRGVWSERGDGESSPPGPESGPESSPSGSGASGE